MSEVFKHIAAGSKNYIDPSYITLAKPLKNSNLNIFTPKLKPETMIRILFNVLVELETNQMKQKELFSGFREHDLEEVGHADQDELLSNFITWKIKLEEMMTNTEYKISEFDNLQSELKGNQHQIKGCYDLVQKNREAVDHKTEVLVRKAKMMEMQIQEHMKVLKEIPNIRTVTDAMKRIKCDR